MLTFLPFGLLDAANLIFKSIYKPRNLVNGKIDFEKVMESKPQKTNSIKKTVEAIDLNELASHGELWVKEDVKFDNNKTDVKTLCIIIGNKFHTFNIYNGSYGKKGNKPPIDDMKAGKAGYDLKSNTRSKERGFEGPHL